jgi:hypothetical protein
MQELLSGQNTVLYRKQMNIDVRYALQAGFRALFPLCVGEYFHSAK